MVDDVLQDTLIAIVLGLPRFEGKTDAQFHAYCYRIARNKVVDAFRRLGKESGRIFPDEEFWEHIAEADPPLSKEEREQLREAMDLLAAVRPPCLDLLIAHYIEAQTFAHIAEEFDFASEDAARMATGRCLRLARELLEE
jgi:RNA polymerase sigma-70 factor (ECF subfamily)